MKCSVVTLLALSTVATTTVAHGAPELVVFVQTAFGNEEGGMSCWSSECLRLPGHVPLERQQGHAIPHPRHQ